MVLVLESGELVLEGLYLAPQESFFLVMLPLLLFDLLLTFPGHSILSVLRLLPILKDPLLQTLLLHFVVVFELYDRELDVLLLVLQVFAVLVFEDKQLRLVLLYLLLSLPLCLVYLGFVGAG